MITFRDQTAGIAPLHERWASVQQPRPLPELRMPDVARLLPLEPSAIVAPDRLRALFDAHFDFVWRSLRRLGVPEATVDDATQEVFLVLSRRLDDVELGCEKSFLFSTALRVASTARRSHARRGAHDDSVDELVDGAPSPSDVVDRQNARRVLDRVLAALDLDLRAVFVLYELEEMTMAEIAAALDLAPGTVASRLRRARETFAAEAARVRGEL